MRPFFFVRQMPILIQNKWILKRVMFVLIGALTSQAVGVAIAVSSAVYDAFQLIFKYEAVFRAIWALAKGHAAALWSQMSGQARPGTRTNLTIP